MEKFKKPAKAQVFSRAMANVSKIAAKVHQFSRKWFQT
ncbi:hypothetical protein SAMN04488542_14232 [Fontibacillus panacisegetis]|uniref:Uncharacterized protein n=1 Tax=Fontibacillus panacisegetis TaxID=670482 RepID=A0A1G7U7J2_9BACL|nr:hypothetical protein SAMN04488542_14232 [Fontibacillus panacisegetis]